jgi:hypothetical protein
VQAHATICPGTHANVDGLLLEVVSSPLLHDATRAAAASALAAARWKLLRRPTM